MARLVAIGLLLWAVYTSIGYSVDRFPEPSAAVATEAKPSPVEAISEVELGPEPLQEPYRRRPVAAAGAYAVADSPDPKVAARDRDYRPRRRLFVSDEDALDPVDRDSEDSDDTTRRRLVEGDIEPGLYTTAFDTENCSYELWRVMRDRNTRVIAEEYLSRGRLLVSINDVEPDWFTSTESCGGWYSWEPMPTPLTSAGDGDYWIGDLARGIWFVPSSCRWEEVVAFRGATLADVVDSGSGPSSLTVDRDTLGIRIRGCRSPITLSSAEGDGNTL